jgi:hypothetical protein
MVMREPVQWYDDNADNPPWIKALAEVRRLAPREGWCYQHVQAIIVTEPKPEHVGLNTMIRHSGALLLAVALFQAPISVGAKVGELTGDDYLRHCTTTKPELPPKNTEEQEMAVYCVGYIEGAVTVLIALDGKSFCMPQNATPQDVLRATFTFMLAHPDQKQYLFASVMLAAARDQWPCKAK